MVASLFKRAFFIFLGALALPAYADKPTIRATVSLQSPDFVLTQLFDLTPEDATRMLNHLDETVTLETLRAIEDRFNAQYSTGALCFWRGEILRWLCKRNPPLAFLRSILENEPDNQVALIAAAATNGEEWPDDETQSYLLHAFSDGTGLASTEKIPVRTALAPTMGRLLTLSSRDQKRQLTEALLRQLHSGLRGLSQSSMDALITGGVFSRDLRKKLLLELTPQNSDSFAKAAILSGLASTVTRSSDDLEQRVDHLIAQEPDPLVILKACRLSVILGHEQSVAISTIAALSRHRDTPHVDGDFKQEIVMTLLEYGTKHPVAWIALQHMVHQGFLDIDTEGKVALHLLVEHGNTAPFLVAPAIEYLDRKKMILGAADTLDDAIYAVAARHSQVLVDSLLALYPRLSPEGRIYLQRRISAISPQQGIPFLLASNDPCAAPILDYDLPPLPAEIQSCIESAIARWTSEHSHSAR